MTSKNSQMLKAVWDGDINKVTRLLNEGVNPNLRDAEVSNSTLLILSAWNLNYDLVKILLNNGADPSLRNDEDLSVFDISNTYIGMGEISGLLTAWCEKRDFENNVTLCEVKNKKRL